MLLVKIDIFHNMSPVISSLLICFHSLFLELFCLFTFDC